MEIIMKRRELLNGLLTAPLALLGIKKDKFEPKLNKIDCSPMRWGRLPDAEVVMTGPHPGPFYTILQRAKPMPKVKNVEMTFNPIDYAAILDAFKNAAPNTKPGFTGFMNVSMPMANAQNLYSAVVGAISFEKKPPLPHNPFI